MRDRLAGLSALLVLLASCAGGGIPAPAEGPGGPAPRAALERFFELAGQRRYLDMAWVFGSREGAYVQQVNAADAERTMYLFSCLLEPLRETVQSEMQVPGSIGSAVEYAVRLEGGGEVVQLPFRVVRGPSNRWFVERFDLQAITGSGLPIAPACLSAGLPR